jgi:hypothetical protein
VLVLRPQTEIAWALLRQCCPEGCCRDRQLQADSGGFHSFGKFAEISRLLWWQGEARGAGAGAGTAGQQSGMNNASSGGIFSHRDIL